MFIFPHFFNSGIHATFFRIDVTIPFMNSPIFAIINRMPIAHRTRELISPMNQNSTPFTAFFDKYCNLLYSIALQIAPTPLQAEKILTATFKKAYQQNLAEQDYPFICAALIKLIIKTAHQQLSAKEISLNVKLKQFEKTQLLHILLCDHINLEDYCSANKITREQATKNLRVEFNQLRNTKSDNSFFVQSAVSI